jgi:MraZ protein
VGILERPHFRGQSLNRIDAKGRLRIPTKFREVLQNHFKDALVVTMMDKCLVAYPPETWEGIESKVEDFSLIQPYQRAFMQLFISSAEVCEFDDQGRILIPSVLRKKAGLEQEVLLAGMLKGFEIWDKAAWDKRLEWNDEHYEEIVKEVAITGF